MKNKNDILIQKLIVEFMGGESGGLKKMHKFVSDRFQSLNMNSVSRRTLQTHLSKLNVKYGHQKIKNRYQFVDPDTKAFEDFNVLNQSEAQYAPLLLSLIKQFDALPLAKKAVKILEKEFNIKGNYSDSEKILHLIEFKLNNSDEKNLELQKICSGLIEAINEKHFINFSYCRVYESAVKKYEEVIPLKMILKDGLYYLYGAVLDQKTKKYGLRNFNIHEIIDFTAINKSYEVSHLIQLNKDLEFSLKFSPGVFIVDREKYDIKYLFYKFSDWAATYISNLKIHDSQKIIMEIPETKTSYVRFVMAVVKKDTFDINDNPEIAFLMGRFREYVELLAVNDEEMNWWMLKEKCGL